MNKASANVKSPLCVNEPPNWAFCSRLQPSPSQSQRQVHWVDSHHTYAPVTLFVLGRSFLGTCSLPSERVVAMNRHLFLAFNTFVIVAIFFIGSAVPVASQTATATATPCPTGTPASTQAPTVAPTLSAAATAEATAAATPDFSVVDTFSKLAAQIGQQPHQTVKSADGEVTLLIPKGALPDNVPLSK